MRRDQKVLCWVQLGFTVVDQSALYSAELHHFSDVGGIVERTPGENRNG